MTRCLMRYAPLTPVKNQESDKCMSIEGNEAELPILTWDLRQKPFQDFKLNTNFIRMV